MPSPLVETFQRSNAWQTAEILRIAAARFDAAYIPLVREVVQNCSDTLSVVVKNPNKEKSLAAFVLVCTPETSTRWAYGHRVATATRGMYEIAFCATDSGHEGRGFARAMFSHILTELRALGASAWLHVDIINPRAISLYQSLGFAPAMTVEDPFGSLGLLMVFGADSSAPRRDSDSYEWATLFNAGPSEAEKSFCGGILTPPGVAC